MELNNDQRNIAAQFEAFLDQVKPRDTASLDERHFTSPTFFIGGYAGTGKTSILGVIADMAKEHIGGWNEPGLGTVRVAAPTNKATKRLRAKTGLKATTLHFLLGAKPKLYLTRHIGKLERKAKLLADEQAANPDDHSKDEARINTNHVLVLLKEVKSLEERIEALGDEQTPLRDSLMDEIQKRQEKMLNFPTDGGALEDHDILICDESSMVAQELREKILARKPAAIVWVGDPGQLDPVKSARWFNPPPQTTLRTVMRQDGDSGVLELATLVRKGNANTANLSKLIQSQDVEFVNARGGQPIDWDRLVDDYGDRWLTWRNSYKTRNHPFHTKPLNERFRAVLGHDPSFPVPGDRLYVTGRYRNYCKRYKENGLMISKGDEVIVRRASRTGDPTTLNMNSSPSTQQGFTRVKLQDEEALEEAVENRSCICDLIAEQEGAMPDFCNAGANGASGFFRGAPDYEHPWAALARESQGLYMDLATAPDLSEGTKGGVFIPNALVDPRPLLWDERQRTEIWKTEQMYNEMCDGDLTRSLSPTKSLLEAAYGYAISVHQSQGSEWDNVAVFWDPLMLKHGPDNAVRWLYTSITRARKRLCIITI